MYWTWRFEQCLAMSLKSPWSLSNSVSRVAEDGLYTFIVFLMVCMVAAFCDDKRKIDFVYKGGAALRDLLTTEIYLHSLACSRKTVPNFKPGP